MNSQNSSTAYYSLKTASMTFLIILLAATGCVLESGESEYTGEEAVATELDLQAHEQNNEEILSWDEYLEGMPMDEYLEELTRSKFVGATTAEGDDIDILCVPSPFTDYDCTSSGCSGQGRLRYRTCEECNGVVTSCGSWTYTQMCC